MPSSGSEDSDISIKAEAKEEEIISKVDPFDLGSSISLPLKSSLPNLPAISFEIKLTKCALPLKQK